MAITLESCDMMKALLESYSLQILLQV